MPLPGALYCARCGSVVAEPERAPSGLPSRSVGSLGGEPAPAAPGPSQQPSWDLPTPVVEQSGPTARRRRPSGALRVLLEVVVIGALTVLAIGLLDPFWFSLVLQGEVDPWPVPTTVWWAAAVPVLGIAVAVLVRRTGRPTEPVRTHSGDVGPSWPASFTPPPPAAPAASAGAPVVEVPQAWLPSRPVAPGAPAPVTGVPESDIERTQLRSPTPATAPAEKSRGWTARLDDGTEIDLHGPVIIGRDPASAAGEPAARLVPVADPSISKTHLRLDPDPDRVLVVDRYSTNGVEILGPDGTVTDCVPGAPTPVPEGGTVRFGDRALVLHRT